VTALLSVGVLACVLGSAHISIRDHSSRPLDSAGRVHVLDVEEPVVLVAIFLLALVPHEVDRVVFGYIGLGSAVVADLVPLGHFFERGHPDLTSALLYFLAHSPNMARRLFH